MQADIFFVWAKTDPSAGKRGVSCFIVPGNSPGISRFEIPYAGQIATNCSSVFFDSIRVPRENLLGNEGEGFYLVTERFGVIRSLIGISVLAQAQTSLEEVIKYTRSRTAFGRPIAKYEGISFKIAEAATQIEAARLLCYRALWMVDRGERNLKESAMAKCLAPAVAAEVIHNCILMTGHYAYSREYPLIQRLLDVIGYEIAEGTAEAQKLIITREMIGREFLPYVR